MYDKLYYIIAGASGVVLMVFVLLIVLFLIIFTLFTILLIKSINTNRKMEKLTLKLEKILNSKEKGE